MNYGCYVKGFFTYKYNEWMNEDKENIMSESLLKGFPNRTLMDENGWFRGWNSSWVEMNFLVPTSLLLRAFK